jgi:anti-anti-sigma factor
MTGNATGVPQPPGHPTGGVPDAPTHMARTDGVQQILDQALDGDSLYRLRASVAAHAVQVGLSQRRADDLVIAAHELAANVVRHGSGRGRLRIWKHDQMLHCQVTDDGIADTAGGTEESSRDPGARSVPGTPTWRIEPGHGLWLVRQLADQTSLHPGIGGSAATISFALGHPGSAEPFTLAERSSDGSVILAIAGQLDLNSAGELTDAVERLLGEDPAASLVIDLAGLTFWDAFGLACLLRAQGRVAASAGASLVLADMPDQLAIHLKETGLADRFTRAAGPDDAAGGLPACGEGPSGA